MEMNEVFGLLTALILGLLFAWMLPWSLDRTRRKLVEADVEAGLLPPEFLEEVKRAEKVF